MNNNVLKNEKDYIVVTIEEFFQDYTVVTLEEYFKVLDRDAQKRSKMVAKSLGQYLKKASADSKYNKLQSAY